MNQEKLRPEPGPVYLRDPQLAALLRMFQSLAEETAVTRDRMMTLEQLLLRRNVLQPGEIDAYVPSPAEAAERIGWHTAFTARLYEALHAAARSSS